MPEFDLPALDTLHDGRSGLAPIEQISIRLLEQVSFDVPDGFVQQELALDGIDNCQPGSVEWAAVCCVLAGFTLTAAAVYLKFFLFLYTALCTLKVKVPEN